jgi:hypothetical protein
MVRLHAYIRDAGRNPADIGIEGRFSIANTTPDDWGGAVEDWRSLGATHLGLNTMGAGLASPRDHIEALRRFKEAVAISSPPVP